MLYLVSLKLLVLEMMHSKIKYRVKIKCWVKNAIKEFTSLGSNLKLHFGFCPLLSNNPALFL